LLQHLKLTNIGPSMSMELKFGSRLNILTGDNGLGKSFLLDIAWWSLTRKWPADINSRLTGGKKAIPTKKNEEAKIEFSFSGKVKTKDYASTFLKKEQAWTGRAGRPSNPGLVLYAMSDGSFAVWDPARNYWRTQEGVDIQERIPAYVFSPTDAWDGLSGERGSWLCNGLIRDWTGWQKENSGPFKLLKEVLLALSPSENERLIPGNLTRVSLDDVRDIPTIRMPYGQDVAVIHASSGMRRIMALAYFLVWAWEEHKQAAKQIGEQETHQIVFLIDEIESHLHPTWQRAIVPALLSVMMKLARHAETQLITATHSPLIMASLEPLFDDQQDAWFDLDLEPSGKNNQRVVLSRRTFVRHGEATNWLTSNAFDLPSARSIEGERVLEEASNAMADPNFGKAEAQAIDKKLRGVLGDTDPFWMRWRFVAEKKGWLE
jgi:predicted ATPase